MRLALAVLVVATVACGSAAHAPAVGTPLNTTQLKFAVMDSVGKPVYCDPDFYPIARQGGEEANAVSTYPQIKADAESYAAIVAHEHLPSGDLTDAQKLVVYRAWTLLRPLFLADGRELLVAPGHKTADGRPVGTLRAGDRLDGSTINRLELVPYAGGRTYDLLPAGATGHYWANGILLSSTLS